MPGDTQQEILNRALELADEGMPVFPVGQNKTPVWAKGESPVGRDGLHAASTIADEIEALFAHPATRGIGRPTGLKSRVTVVDVDCGRGKKNREIAMSWVEGHRQSTLWGATVVRTPSGGLHYYCKYTPGLTTRGNLWAKGVDCRNDGGYVVIPPFMGYRFEREVDPDDWPAPPAAPVNPHRDRASGDFDGTGQTPPHIRAMIDTLHDARGDGDGWHDAVRDLTAHLVGSGWSDAEILTHVIDWTTNGYTHRETFEQVCVMLAGARQKWDRDRTLQNRHESAIKLVKLVIPKLTRDDQIALIHTLKEITGHDG